MKNLYLKVSFLVVLIFALSESRSQEVFPVTGGDVSGSGGSISFYSRAGF